MAYQYVREPLRVDEADRIANACKSSQEKLIVWTLLDTGLRVSELCSLSPNDILLRRRLIRVRSKGGSHMGKVKIRMIPMSDRIWGIMKPFFELHSSFPVGARQVQKIVRAVAGRARIKRNVTPHVLRRTAASLMIQEGIALSTVQEILGHDRLSTTSIYMNLSKQHNQKEYEAKS